MGFNPTEKNWFNTAFDIELGKMYYVYFSDKKREVTRAEREKYNGIIALPGALSAMQMLKEEPSVNPGVTKMTGRQVIQKCAEGYIPFFDGGSVRVNRNGIPIFNDFRGTEKLTLVAVDSIEAYKQLREQLQERSKNES